MVLVVRGKRRLVVLFLTVLLSIVCLYSGYFAHSFLAKYNTDYTGEFSIAKFDTIEAGISKQQVYQILGEPFGISSTNNEPDGYVYECVNYSRQRSLPELFFPWISVYICFDENGKVFNKAQVILD
jgi:hypothetical protein